MKMTGLIITKPIKVKDLIDALSEEFDMGDVVTTGLWIRKK